MPDVLGSELDTAAPASSDYVLGLQGGVFKRFSKSAIGPFINVKDPAYGATGDGSTDDTAAIQAAINTGLSLFFPEGTYKSGPLTQSTAGQKFFALGTVTLSKNANGVLLTSSGDYFEVEGISFVGTGYTGNNINATGNHPRFVRCSSIGTPGRALKATGSHVQILGTSGTYTTTDATASGYDIEIGVSGTATLYHELHGVYTSQAAGGILLTDVGSHSIVGGQFGKLTIAAGTSPAGINGGKTVGARILGAVSVGLSNASFVGNQFGSVAVTVESGVTGVSIDESNSFAVGATLTNSTGAQIDLRKFSGSKTSNNSLSANAQVYRFGDDSSLAFMAAIPSTGTFEFFGRTYATQFALPNNAGFEGRNTGGTLLALAKIDASDNLTFGGNYGNYTVLAGSSNGVYVTVNATTIAQFYASGFRPNTDGTLSLGSAAQRWLYVHSKPVTVASLTAAATVAAGTRAFVSDANATTFASVVAGGGANVVPVYSDGTDWRIG